MLRMSVKLTRFTRVVLPNNLLEAHDEDHQVVTSITDNKIRQRNLSDTKVLES